jgi:hypothetical protein
MIGLSGLFHAYDALFLRDFLAKGRYEVFVATLQKL